MPNPTEASPAPAHPGACACLILIPLFNDWDAFLTLAPRLDDALSAAGREADVLLVDDASTRDLSPDQVGALPGLRALRRIAVLTLRRNLGHQRAIAIGLTYVQQRRPPGYEAVVVMDGDGEDDPADVPRLLQRLEAEGGTSIIFAERTRRSESLTFRVCYFLYRQLHLVLTSRRVRVGNFSAIPRRRLESLVAVSDLWNHYAAAVFHSRQPYATLPTRRARRLGGRSSMNFAALVTHGLSAISVFREVIGVRLLMLAAVLALLALAGLAVTVFLRLATPLAIPGWATSTTGLLLLLFLQAIMLSFVFCFVILGDRSGTSFLPLRDYAYFIGGTRTLYERPPPDGASAHEARPSPNEPGHSGA
jgi:hypothetical protein